MMRMVSISQQIELCKHIGEVYVFEDDQKIDHAYDGYYNYNPLRITINIFKIVDVCLDLEYNNNENYKYGGLFFKCEYFYKGKFYPYNSYWRPERILKEKPAESFDLLYGRKTI